jgi:WD40 repeat protein
MLRYFLIAALTVLAAGHATAQPAVKASAESPAVRSLSFSPDGTRLVAAVVTPGGGGRVRIWDVAGRKLVCKSDKTGDLPTASFTHDGKAVVLADGKAVVTVLDPTTGKATGELGPFPSEVTSVTRGAKGQWLALGKDGAIRLWDVAEKKVLREFVTGKRMSAWSVSPNADWLFTAGDAGDKLWNLRTGEAVAGMFPARPGLTSRGVFMDDGRLLVGNNNGTHRIIEVPTGKELLRFKNEGGPDIIAYSSAAGLMANRYSMDTRAALTPVTLRPPTDAESERVATLLKACDSDDYPTREKAAAALLDVGPAIEPLLRKATTDGPSAEVRMRARVARENLLNKPKFQLAGHADEIRPMVFSPDGKLFATGAADGFVILWDPRTGKELARLSASAE